MTLPFSAASADLGEISLDPLRSEDCARLAQSIVAMAPWSVMNYPADDMRSFLEATSDTVIRYRLERRGEDGGIVSIRYPWLKGPYLELLALLPNFQGKGLGTRILRWLERETVRLEARNLWVCASSFNHDALRLYERHGFQRVATLPGLVVDGYDEILLRKFPLNAQS
ncbi:MAG: GNAT family N-acetyltransferase [Alphaproteobacteria bacterium]|nr:GNAT family N-acetyltransferase [Alphaproteobacteria bacterium]